MCYKCLVQKDFSCFNEITEFHTLPSIRFRVFSLFSLMMRPLAHSELSFVKGFRYGSIFILSHKVSRLTGTIVWRLCHFPGVYVLLIFIKNQEYIDVFIYVLIFSSIPLVNMSISVNTMLFFLFYNSSKIETEIWAGATYSFSILLIF